MTRTPLHASPHSLTCLRTLLAAGLAASLPGRAQQATPLPDNRHTTHATLFGAVCKAVNFFKFYSSVFQPAYYVAAA